VGHNVHHQIGVQRSGNPVQASSHPIVIEVFDIFAPKIKQLGTEVARPLGNSVN
jgi:hypothetical protein